MKSVDPAIEKLAGGGVKKFLADDVVELNEAGGIVTVLMKDGQTFRLIDELLHVPNEQHVIEPRNTIQRIRARQTKTAQPVNGVSWWPGGVFAQEH